MSEFRPASRHWPEGMKRIGVSPWWGAKVLLQFGAILYASMRMIDGPSAWGVATPWAPGLALLLAGGLCELWHYGLLKMHDRRVGDTRRLLTRGGLFRRVRHPMYLGDAAMAAGALWIAADVAGLVLAGLFVAALVPLVRDEDALLAEKFGEEFHDWAARTRRLVPWVW